MKIAIETKYPIKSKNFIVEIQQVGKDISAEVYSQPKKGYMVVVWWGNKIIDATYDLEKQTAKDLAHKIVTTYKEKETVRYV